MTQINLSRAGLFSNEVYSHPYVAGQLSSAVMGNISYNSAMMSTFQTQNISSISGEQKLTKTTISLDTPSLDGAAAEYLQSFYYATNAGLSCFALPTDAQELSPASPYIFMNDLSITFERAGIDKVGAVPELSQSSGELQAKSSGISLEQVNLQHLSNGNNGVNVTVLGQHTPLPVAATNRVPVAADYQDSVSGCGERMALLCVNSSSAATSFSVFWLRAGVSATAPVMHVWSDTPLFSAPRAIGSTVDPSTTRFFCHWMNPSTVFVGVENSTLSWLVTFNEDTGTSSVVQNVLPGPLSHTNPTIERGPMGSGIYIATRGPGSGCIIHHVSSAGIIEVYRRIEALLGFMVRGEGSALLLQVGTSMRLVQLLLWQTHDEGTTFGSITGKFCGGTAVWDGVAYFVLQPIVSGGVLELLRITDRQTLSSSNWVITGSQANFSGLVVGAHGLCLVYRGTTFSIMNSTDNFLVEAQAPSPTPTGQRMVCYIRGAVVLVTKDADGWSTATFVVDFTRHFTSYLYSRLVEYHTDKPLVCPFNLFIDTSLSGERLRVVGDNSTGSYLEYVPSSTGGQSRRHVSFGGLASRGSNLFLTSIMRHAGVSSDYSTYVVPLTNAVGGTFTYPQAIYVSQAFYNNHMDGAGYSVLPLAGTLSSLTYTATPSRALPWTRSNMERRNSQGASLSQFWSGENFVNRWTSFDVAVCGIHSTDSIPLGGV